MGDVRDVLQASAARPRRDVDMNRLHTLATRRGRTQLIVASALVLALVPAGVVAVRLLPDRPSALEPAQDAPAHTRFADEDNTFPRPRPGEVWPAVLRDGTRVFVVGHRDGAATVVDASSPHARYGGTSGGFQVGWCASSGWFQEPFGGSSRFDGSGRYAYGPAPTGLATYAVAIHEQRVRVGERRPGLPRGARVEPHGPLCAGPRDGTAGLIFPDYPRPATRPLTPRQMLQARPGTVGVVHALVATDADFRLRLCDRSADLTHCRSSGLIVRGIPASSGGGRNPQAEIRLVTVRRDGEGLTDLTLLPQDPESPDETAGSFVRADPQSIYICPMQGDQRCRTEADASVSREWAEVLNRSPQHDPSMTCPPDYGDTAQLSFGYEDGSSDEVTLRLSGCQTAQRTDVQGSLVRAGRFVGLLERNYLAQQKFETLPADVTLYAGHCGIDAIEVRGELWFVTGYEQRRDLPEHLARRGRLERVSTELLRYTDRNGGVLELRRGEAFCR